MNEGTKKERDREGEREGEKKDSQTKPDTFFVKAIMVRAVDGFVVDSFRSVTCYFLFLVVVFFRNINDLELLLNDFQNRLFMAKAEDGLFNPEQCEQHLVSIFKKFRFVLEIYEAKNIKRRGSIAKIGPLKRTAHTKNFTCADFCRKTVHFTPKFYNFLFYFLRQRKKKVLKICFLTEALSKEKNQPAVQNTHVITTIHHT
jgi:hypothetical protein